MSRPGKPDLMETVSRYVCACDRRGWRPVFTKEQIRAIEACDARGNPWISGDIIIFPDGVGWAFTVSDTPRPPMPEEMLDRDSVIEEPEQRQPKVDGFYGAVQTMFENPLTHLQARADAWQQSKRTPRGSWKLE